MAETQVAAKINFADGRTEVWSHSPGLNISGEALAEFFRVCLKSPVEFTVEIIEIPVESMRHQPS